MYSAFKALDFAVTVAFSIVNPISAKASPPDTPSCSASAVVYKSIDLVGNTAASAAESAIEDTGLEPSAGSVRPFNPDGSDPIPARAESPE